MIFWFFPLHESFMKNQQSQSLLNLVWRLCGTRAERKHILGANPTKYQRAWRAACHWERFNFIKGNLKRLFQVTFDCRTLIVCPLPFSAV